MGSNDIASMVDLTGWYGQLKRDRYCGGRTLDGGFELSSVLLRVTALCSGTLSDALQFEGNTVSFRERCGWRKCILL